MNPEEEFKEKGRQRTAFLCEVYKKTEGDPSKSVSYEQIAISLNFQKDAVEQACLYLEGERFIEINLSPFLQEVIPPEGRTVGQPQSTREKLISLTDKGISHARRICHS